MGNRTGALTALAENAAASGFPGHRDLARSPRQIDISPRETLQNLYCNHPPQPSFNLCFVSQRTFQIRPEYLHIYVYAT